MRGITRDGRIWTSRAAVAALSLSACLEIDEPIRGLGALEVVSGNNQDVIVGQPAAAPLVIRAVQQSTLPAVGVTVNWNIATGGGSLSAATSVTDAAGTASVIYTAGNTVGTVFVRAQAEDLSLTLTLNVRNPEAPLATRRTAPE
ncbi:MAG TPA: hypothetical protein VIF83_08270 [Gemmatimonadaceae bacterium]|jgi:hypothetical protein